MIIKHSIIHSLLAGSEILAPTQQFMRFLLAGGFAAMANFGSRFIFSLAVDFQTAVVLAFVTGLTTGYLLNKRYVFTNSANSRSHEMGWFFAINMLALAQTWGLSVYLAEYLLPGILDKRPLIEAIAHLAGILLPVFTSFIGHKYLTFRE